MTGIHIEKPILFIIGLIISAVVAFLYYYKDQKFEHVNRIWIYLMALLRFFALFLIFLLLSNPLIKTIVKSKQKPIIVLLQDNSKSIPLATDSSYTEKYLKDLSSLTRHLKQKFDLRIFTFSDSVRQSSKIDFSGNYTNISQAIYEINQRFYNQNLAAIILASDGIYNQGIDPAYRASQSPVPIYTIVLGDTNEYKDLSVNNLHTNSIIFLHEKFPVQAQINAVHAQGEKIKVSLLINGRIIDQKIIEINKDYFSTTVNFIVKAPSPGKKLLTVSVSTLQDERNTLNNSSTTVIEVIDSRQKILILSSFPHPDIATIRRSLNAIPTYKVEFSYFDKFQGKIDGYSLIILYQMPDDRTNALSIQRLLQASSKPVLLVCGPQTDLTKLKKLNLGISYNPIQGSVDQAQAIVNKDFDIFLPPKNMDNLLSNLPPLIVPYIDFDNVNNQYVLLWQKVNNITTSKPLVQFVPLSPLNNNKLGIIWGEGIWRWRMTEYRNTGSSKNIDQLILQTTQFLMTNENRKRFNVKVKPIIDQNQEVIFNAELYDLSYNPITEPDVNLTLQDSAGNTFDYIFEKAADHYVLNIGILPEGIYSYQASCKWKSQTFVDNGSFVVRAINIEATSLKANTDLLQKIASYSGAKPFYDSQISSLENELLINSNFPSLIETQTQIKQGINYYVILFLIIFSLTVEWILRKYFGNI